AVQCSRCGPLLSLTLSLSLFPSNLYFHNPLFLPPSLRLFPHSLPFHTAASGEGSTAASFLGRRSARIRSCSAAASPAGGLARAPGAGLRGRSSCVTRARCVRIARPAPGACRDSAGRLDLGASACGNQ
ncbi:putative receptor-like protein kinase, partial [Zea mays]